YVKKPPAVTSHQPGGVAVTGSGMDEEQRLRAAERMRARVRDPAFELGRKAGFARYIDGGPDRSAQFAAMREYWQTPQFTDNQSASGRAFATKLREDPD